MRRRVLLSIACLLAVLLVTSQFLQGADPPQGAQPKTERMVIKLCNWDGVVPAKAVDGFILPASLADYEKDGWQVEGYVVAPNAGAKSNGFFAVLRK
jgi:hypothetical protein